MACKSNHVVVEIYQYYLKSIYILHRDRVQYYTKGSHVYWKTNFQALLLMIVTKCHSMAKVNTENLSLIYSLLICHRMSSNKRFKKPYGLKIMIKAKKNLFSAGVSLLLVVKVESNSFYISHVVSYLQLYNSKLAQHCHHRVVISKD